MAKKNAPKKAPEKTPEEIATERRLEAIERLSKLPSVRLTSYMGEIVLRQMLGSVIEPKRKKINEVAEKIAKMIVWEATPEKERSLLESLPATWMVASTNFEASVGGLRFYLSGRGQVLMPAFMLRQHPNATLYPASRVLSETLGEHLKEIRALDGEARELENSIRGMLAGFGTTKALLASWPECEKYVAQFIPSALNPNPVSCTALAISGERLQKLNEKLGISFGRAAAQAPTQSPE